MGVPEALGSDVPNLMKNVPNLMKDVPNFVNNVPRVHDFILEPIRKCLGTDPYLETHFGTLGTSFTKFGTSDPIVFGSPI